MSHVVLAPLPIRGAVLGRTVARVGDRFVSAWPAGTVLRPDAAAGGEEGSGAGGDEDSGAPGDSWEDTVPWEQAAALLARLHAAPVPPGRVVPPAGVWRRLERAVGRLAGLDEEPARDVVAAYTALPPWTRQAPAWPGRLSAIIHGDWHLGQLVRLDGQGWRVTDVDDLGYGDPAWDLARPAACYAAGLLGPQAWQRFLRGYQEAGGCALPRGADPWVVLDTPARALAVHCAATAVADAMAAREPLDCAAQAFVDCCRRMTQLRSP